MVDSAAAGGAGATGATDAFGHARALIDAAETEARSILTSAMQRARAREQEADLLVAKARRLLEAAEAKADVILTTARAEAEDHTIDLTDDLEPGGIRRVVNPSGARLGKPLPTRIDRMLSSAIANAVDDVLPASARR